MEIIIKYTNKEANNLIIIRAHNESHEEKMDPWAELEPIEMHAFLGILTQR